MGHLEDHGGGKRGGGMRSNEQKGEAAAVGLQESDWAT